MNDENLLVLVADIVTAQVSHNSVSTNDLPVLIQSVYGSLAMLGKAHVHIEEKREPAVSIRASVKADAIICLECGARLTMLKRHLLSNHDLTPSAYRTRWNLPESYPLVAPDYAVKRKDIAIKFGLGVKLTSDPEPEPAKAKAPRRKRLTSTLEATIEPISE